MIFYIFFFILSLTTYFSSYSATHTVVSVADAGPGTLRQAITDSNADAGPVRLIDFAIVGAPPFIIAPATALPDITAPVTIDGYTQPGALPNTDPLVSNANILIEINGSNYLIDRGLTLAAGSDGSTIRGLAFSEFAINGGINISSNNNIITGNFVGYDTLGTTLKRNAPNILISSADSTPAGNRIGGLLPAERNVIAASVLGNVRGGITELNTQNTLIINNLIGTDKNGAGFPGASGYMGIFENATANCIISQNLISGNGIGTVLWNNSSSTRIQNNRYGTTAGVTGAVPNGIGICFDVCTGAMVIGNIISGNDRGILSLFPATNFLIVNNLIGVDASGMVPLPNSSHGIAVHENYHAGTHGLGNSILNNVIAANGGHGIYMADGSTGIAIYGNTIGLAADRITPLPNGLDGIRLGTSTTAGYASDNTIGQPGNGNIISSNLENGIELINQSNFNTIQSNVIGLTVNGMPAGNTIDGVSISSASNNLIGGNATSQGNLITNNAKGVTIVSAPNNPAVGNSILTNAIYNNTSLGIDLNNDGITPNHATSPTQGPNNFQNFAVITSVANGSTVISGTLHSVPNETFRLQFFLNTVDRPGTTEGRQFLGETFVTTNGAGDASFSVTFPLTLSIGNVVSSTATRLSTGDTSEFSLNVGLRESPIIPIIINKFCTGGQ